MSDKRKIQHEGILALINYSTLCAKKCDVLKTHDDKLGQKEVECLRKQLRPQSSPFSSIYYPNFVCSSLIHTSPSLSLVHPPRHLR